MRIKLKDREKILRKVKKITQKITNFLIRIILFLVYFICITPFGIFIRVFRDYLTIKSKPSWQIHKEIINIDGFLKRQ
jgi:ABC-type glycerol-3-phosphate transport system permease component